MWCFQNIFYFFSRNFCVSAEISSFSFSSSRFVIAYWSIFQWLPDKFSHLNHHGVAVFLIAFPYSVWDLPGSWYDLWFSVKTWTFGELCYVALALALNPAFHWAFSDSSLLDEGDAILPLSEWDRSLDLDCYLGEEELLVVSGWVS